MKVLSIFGWSSLLFGTWWAANGATQGTAVGGVVTAAHADQSGPSMEETVDALRKIYQRQQPMGIEYGSRQGFLFQTLSSLEQPEPCQFELLTRNHDVNPETDWDRRSLLDLAHSDPLSVAVVADTHVSGEFKVEVKNAIGVSDWVAPEPDTAPVQPYGFGVGADDGYVLSAAPEGITLVNVSRHRFAVPASALQAGKLTREGQPATPGMIQVGRQLALREAEQEGASGLRVRGGSLESAATAVQRVRNAANSKRGDGAARGKSRDSRHGVVSQGRKAVGLLKRMTAK